MLANSSATRVLAAMDGYDADTALLPSASSGGGDSEAIDCPVPRGAPLAHGASVPDSDTIPVMVEQPVAIGATHPGNGSSAYWAITSYISPRSLLDG